MTTEKELEYAKREIELLKEIIKLKEEVAKKPWPNRTIGIDKNLFGGCSFS